MWIREEEVDKLIRSKPNVLSWRYDLTKIKQGRDTGIPCITVFVKKKVKASRLRRDELIPEEINGIPTDVIELSSRDFEIGETRVGKLPPHIQKRIAGGVKE